MLLPIDAANESTCGWKGWKFGPELRNFLRDAPCRHTARPYCQRSICWYASSMTQPISFATDILLTFAVSGRPERKALGRYEARCDEKIWICLRAGSELRSHRWHNLSAYPLGVDARQLKRVQCAAKNLFGIKISFRIRV